MKKIIRNLIPIKSFEQVLYEDDTFKHSLRLNNLEKNKQPFRDELIKFLLDKFPNNKKYLEIGVRIPADNFNQINCEIKYSVDPGIEYKENPVDFKLTSDDFFDKLSNGLILDKNIKFDVIFIDGLHLANQVYKDMFNSLNYLTDDGFIVLHDCNPPTEYHAREDHNFILSPARNFWNGSVWKAFYKMRFNTEVSCFCIDSDWGIGVITKRKYTEPLIEDFNPFLEYFIFDAQRKESLNLMDFETFKSMII